MSLSLAVEPRRKGMFEPFYWTRPPVQSNFHLLTPFFFPEALPTITCINRAMIQRGRMDSCASTMSIQDLQYLRELQGVQPSANLDSSKVNGFDLGGTVIVVYEGELMLMVQPVDPMAASRPASRAPSRPPSSIVDSPPAEKGNFSRNPSVRVKPGHKSLERKASQLRRSSLPALSKKPSFEPPDLPSERPLRVVIQAGTLDRLVTVLVEGLHGVSVSVADDNGEMPLNDKKTREIRVDMDDFCRVWWSTFRSFLTPHVFFDVWLQLHFTRFHANILVSFFARNM
jgi:GTPase-activating protein BEM2